MFGNLFKEKKHTEQSIALELSLEDKVALQQENEKINAAILSGKNQATIEHYNQLGENQIKLGEIDDAINSFEQSLKIKESFGVAYNNLLNLYEDKRKGAAQKKDNEAIQKWITKTDSLLALSKRVMKSNF
ncbi:hypothetical protein ACVPPR_07975 [Dellaglioa sp. L3N]